MLSILGIGKYYRNFFQGKDLSKATGFLSSPYFILDNLSVPSISEEVHARVYSTRVTCLDKAEHDGV